jgi:hypothetical protein
MKFCAGAPSTSSLTASFDSLTLSDRPTTSILPSSTAAAPSFPASPNADLATVLSSLRKLREALISTSRHDSFAQRVYIFNIHTALLCKAWESYSPALLHLLYTIHPVTPLPDNTLHEFLGYLVLDTACRQGDLARAYELRNKWEYHDRRVNLVLRALVRDDWVVFWKMKRAVDGYQRRILEYAEQGVRVHALKCLGRSYLSAERAFVERTAERDWLDLVKDGVGWRLEGENVVIRTIKGRTS